MLVIALAAAALACSRLSLAATPTLFAAAAYTGQFDCYGSEAGLGAYAGRITIQASGAVTFKDYDGIEQAGAWTYDAPANTFTFTGGTPLISAIYKPSDDTLVALFQPNASVVHAEGGGVQCQRAKPGITGPP